MAVCPSCGAELAEGARFCTDCGARIEAPASPAPELSVPELSVPEAPAVPAEETPAVPEPEVSQPSPAFEAAAPVYAAPAAPAAPVYPAPAASADSDRPGKKSPYAPMTSWGMAIQIILMSIPVLGFILMILWSCGVCRKIARRNLARAYLILLIIAVVLALAAALLVRFVFAEDITRIFEELLPGYTIQWS